MGARAPVSVRVATPADGEEGSGDLEGWQESLRAQGEGPLPVEEGGCAEEPERADCGGDEPQKGVERERERGAKDEEKEEVSAEEEEEGGGWADSRCRHEQQEQQ